jgi:hypothetical protein
MTTRDDVLSRLDRYIKSSLSADFIQEPSSLDEYLAAHHSTKTFSVLLNELREKQKMSPQTLYTRASVDRRLYSKIMGERDYRPSKNTVIAFGLALELAPGDMKELLETAGFALCATSIFDLVILFCLENRIYDSITVTELLYSQRQPLLTRVPD